MNDLATLRAIWGCRFAAVVVVLISANVWTWWAINGANNAQRNCCHCHAGRPVDANDMELSSRPPDSEDATELWL